MRGIDYPISPSSTDPEPQGFHRLKPGPGRPADLVKADQQDRIRRAMIEIVGAEGYRGVTVRKLTKMAHVSTATFYAQFDGTEDCFLGTYSMLMDRISERVLATRLPTLEQVDQLEFTLEVLVREMADPLAARFALVEVYGAGPAGLNRLDLQERALSDVVAGCLGRRGSPVGPLVAEWIVAGVLRAIRARVLIASPVDSPHFAQRLAVWGASHLFKMPGHHRELLPAKKPVNAPELVPQGDERSILMSALVRRAKSDGYWRLTPSWVCQVAGLSNAKFKRHFNSIDACFQASLRVLTTTYFRPFLAEEPLATSCTTRLTRATAMLRSAVAADPELARLTFVEVLNPGASGLMCRENLITDLSVEWRRSKILAERPADLFVEASIAALWSAVARSIRTGPHAATREWDAFSRLLSAPYDFRRDKSHIPLA